MKNVQQQQWNEDWNQEEYYLVDENQLSRDEEVLNDIKAMAQASQAKEQRNKIRLLGTIGIVVVSAGVTLGFWLLVKLSQAPKQEQTKISQELAEEVQAQKNYAQAIQKVDATVLFSPATASPGYRQILWMNLGASLKSRYNQQLNDPEHICGRRGQDISSCAAIEEFSTIDKTKYQAINGQAFFLAFKDDTGRIVPLRQFTVEEVLDNAEFRKLAMDSAVSTVNLTPSIDPFVVDRQRDKVLKARIQRLEAENKTDAAAKIAEKSQALRIVEDSIPPKPVIKMQQQTKVKPKPKPAVSPQIKAPKQHKERMPSTAPN